MAQNGTDGLSVGRIIAILGPVVDAEFPDGQLPDVYAAVEIPLDGGGKLVCEVQQQLGSNRVRTVAMSSTDGLRRGMDVINTGAPIMVPVGPETLGRLFNVLGELIDQGPEIKTDLRYPIHRSAPSFVDRCV